MIVRPEIERWLATASDADRIALDEFISVLRKNGDSGSLALVLRACVEQGGLDYVLHSLTLMTDQSDAGLD